jgi:hypothetical protein
MMNTIREDNITAIVVRFDGKPLSAIGNFRLDNQAMILDMLCICV